MSSGSFPQSIILSLSHSATIETIVLTSYNGEETEERENTREILLLHNITTFAIFSLKQLLSDLNNLIHILVKSLNVQISKDEGRSKKFEDLAEFGE